MDIQDEKKLVEEVLKGNESAIRRLHDNYSPPLLALISSKVSRKEDADEILQDTFLSIFDSLPLFNFKSPLLTWAKSIACHEVADFYRKKKIKSIVFSHLPFLEDLVANALGPDLVYQEKELRCQIEKTLASLSEGYQKILRLKYIEGLTVAQIARTLNFSFKSTESKLFRAKLSFQKAWNEKYLRSHSGFSFFSASRRRI